MDGLISRHSHAEGNSGMGHKPIIVLIEPFIIIWIQKAGISFDFSWVVDLYIFIGLRRVQNKAYKWSRLDIKLRQKRYYQ